jgi:hypothetical protein
MRRCISEAKRRQVSAEVEDSLLQTYQRFRTTVSSTVQNVMLVKPDMSRQLQKQHT